MKSFPRAADGPDFSEDSRASQRGVVVRDERWGPRRDVSSRRFAVRGGREDFHAAQYVRTSFDDVVIREGARGIRLGRGGGARVSDGVRS